MSGQVIVYFDEEDAALRFALAAGSVMAGDANRVSKDLLQETARATRILVDASRDGGSKEETCPSSPERAA